MRFQDPKQADTIMRVQAELDETKIVLHKTIESVLERGEKLDSLVERSDALSAQSKMFYKTAKKQVSTTTMLGLIVEFVLPCHVEFMRGSREGRRESLGGCGEEVKVSNQQTLVESINEGLRQYDAVRSAER
jgi:hypothetical protein